MFYVAGDGALVSVQVGSAATWNPGPTVTLIKASDTYFRGTNSAVVGLTYDVSLDGKRFLRIKHPSAQSAGPRPSIVVVRNWIEEVKARVPVPPR